MVDLLQKLRIIFNKTRVYIQFKEQWSAKVKDILSLEILLLIFGMLSYFVTKAVMGVWEVVLREISMMLSLAEDTKSDSLAPFIPMIQNKEIPQLMLNVLLTTIIFVLINFSMILFGKKFSEKMMGRLWIIAGIIGIFIYFLFYSIPWEAIIIGFPVLLLFYLKFPFGTGKYLEILRYLDYLFDSFDGYFIKEDIKKMAITIFITLLLSFSIFISVPGITIAISLLVSSIIILLILKNLSMVHTNFLVELVIYTLLIPFIVLANNESVHDGLSFMIVFGTLYFSIDRIFSLKDKGKALIRENSMLYYLDEEIQELKKCREILFPLSYFRLNEFDEKEIIRQCLYYWKLEDLNNFNVLYYVYKKSIYNQYLLLIEEIKYELEFNNTKITQKQISYVKSVIKNIGNTPQKLSDLPTIEKWITMLYSDHHEKNAQYIIKLLGGDPIGFSSNIGKIYQNSLEVMKSKDILKSQRNLGKQKLFRRKVH